jgi:hypothetical protein
MTQNLNLDRHCPSWYSNQALPQHEHGTSPLCKPAQSVLVTRYLCYVKVKVTMEWSHMREWRYSSTILDLCNRLRRVVSFTPRPLYSRRKRSQYSLDRKLGGPQNLSGRCEEGKQFAPVGNWVPAVEPLARP